MFYFTTIKKEKVEDKQISLILHEFSRDSKFIKDCYRIIIFNQSRLIFEKQLLCENYTLETAIKLYEIKKNNIKNEQSVETK